MNVKVETQSACRKILRIEVPTESVSSEFEKTIGKFTVAAAIPGFRKGKAPQALIERRYKSEINAEVKDNLILRFLSQALKQTGINPITVMSIDDVLLVKDKPLTYKVSLDVPPEFKLPNYRKIVLKRHKVEITNEDVQSQLDKLRAELAKYEVVEGREVRKSDLVQLDYHGICEGKELDNFGKEVSNFAKAKDAWIEVGKNTFIPEFDSGVFGMKPGEKKEIVVDFPDNFAQQELSGKKVIYQVHVKAIREKKLPAIDADFLKTFKVDSEQELRAKLHESLLVAGGNREEKNLREEIINILLTKTSIDLPESLVEEETRHLFTSMAREILQHGTSKEDFSGHKEELINAATKSASEKVKLAYILHRIAEKEEITVKDEEVEGVVLELARYRHVDPASLRKELTENKKIDSLRQELSMKKTLDFLVKNATKVEEKKFLSRLIPGLSNKRK